MRLYIDFVNAETGEVLGSINTFLDISHNLDEIKLAKTISTYLVEFLRKAENYNSATMVVCTIDYENGKTMQVTVTSKDLLNEEEEDEEEDDAK